MQHPAGELDDHHGVIVRVGGSTAVKEHAVTTVLRGGKHQGDRSAPSKVDQRASARRTSQHFAVPHDRDVDRDEVQVALAVDCEFGVAPFESSLDRTLKKKKEIKSRQDKN